MWDFKFRVLWHWALDPEPLTVPSRSWPALKHDVDIGLGFRV